MVMMLFSIIMFIMFKIVKKGDMSLQNNYQLTPTTVQVTFSVNSVL